MLSASAQNMALNHIPLLKIFDLHNLAGLGYQKYQVACMHQHNTLLVPFLFLGFLNNILLALTCIRKNSWYVHPPSLPMPAFPSCGPVWRGLLVPAGLWTDLASCETLPTLWPIQSEQNMMIWCVLLTAWQGLGTWLPVESN